MGTDFFVKMSSGRAAVLVSGTVVMIALFLGLLAAEPARAATTFTVNRTSNESDTSKADNVCDVAAATAGDQCTLRAAIQQANATANSGGPDEIDLAIPGDKKKVKTIKPTSELPAITQPVIIDGFTQPGSKKNTLATGAINAVPKIQLDGSAATSGADGLTIQTNGTTVRGLVINGFQTDNTGGQGTGIFIPSTTGNDNNVVEGNFIGTDAKGVTAKGNESTGVTINGANSGNTVGGSAPEQRNLISGNRGDGVFAGTAGPDTIQGNLIGTDKTGTKDLGNGGTGNNGEVINLDGQSSVVKNNIIAFNTSDGVQVRDKHYHRSRHRPQLDLLQRRAGYRPHAKRGLESRRPDYERRGYGGRRGHRPQQPAELPHHNLRHDLLQHRPDQDRRVPRQRAQHDLHHPVLLQPARYRRGQDLYRRTAGHHQRQRHRLGQRLSIHQGGPGVAVDNRHGHRPGRQHLGVLGGTQIGQAGFLGRSS